jgi:heat-inducible transcriptional repressor
MIEKQTSNHIITDGKANILLKPEFFNKEQVGSIIEILEEKNLLMHIFGEETESSNRVVVSIGGEIKNGQFSSFSIVKTNYKIGNMEGYLGIIGPKRMPYPYLISAVEYTSKVLEKTYK